MLTQLNLVVILVMACYLNSMIHEVIVWQLDNLLCSTCKEENELDLATQGWVPANKKNNTVLKVQTTSTAASEIDYPY